MVLYHSSIDAIVAQNNKKNKDLPRSHKPKEKTKTEKSPRQKDIEGGDGEGLPEPRRPGNIQVDFTPRKLATPARESKLPEEELV